MNTSCNSCGKQLKLSAKMLESIAGLGPGKAIRVKCPGCSQPISLDSSIVTAARGETAKPDESKSAPEKTQPKRRTTGEKPAPAPGSSVRPPGPPDISWLEEGIFDEEQVIEDVPLAMILMEDSKNRDDIIESIEGIGYKTEVVGSPAEAIEKMQFTEYSAVVLQSKFEGRGLESSEFHKYMCNMDMSRRRFVFYVLIGPEFRTLYNLQALAYSANLVVNDGEIPYFSVIIRKAIPDYEELFGPITEELRIHGK